MPYELSIQEKENYIRVDVSGQRTPGHEIEDAISVWSRVAEVLNEKQIDRVLAIYNLTGRLPARAAHAIAYDPAKFGWSKHFKVALVELNEESRQDMFFAEDVAVSSGYRVRIFDSEQEAEAWLLDI
jgi:predicted fused transcriptional regulator/phosphomethylpyrimidine kinase